eukprot:scaffold142364_cov93-Cyclotella_meneghiniana.AAC.6
MDVVERRCVWLRFWFVEQQGRNKMQWAEGAGGLLVGAGGTPFKLVRTLIGHGHSTAPLHHRSSHPSSIHIPHHQSSAISNHNRLHQKNSGSNHPKISLYSTKD